MPARWWFPTQVDSWAIGATLYLMVEGRYPFDLNNDGGRNVAAMLKAQVKGVFRCVLGMAMCMYVCTARVYVYVCMYQHTSTSADGSVAVCVT